MKLLIDRIEEGFAVVQAENEKTFAIPLDAFDFEVSEGDVIDLTLDEKTKEERQKNISNLMDDLFI